MAETPAHTDADYYSFFMTALLGLIDDAERGGYDAEAIRHLDAARELLWAEFHRRHPEYWNRAPGGAS